MNGDNSHIYKEIIERYCNVIGGNTPIMRTGMKDGVTYECLCRELCEKMHGCCKNEKYGAKPESKTDIS